MGCLDPPFAPLLVLDQQKHLILLRLLPYLSNMAKSARTLRTCPAGHRYYKSSDCPPCPVCANEAAVPDNFLGKLGKPARNTLLHYGIDTIEKLAAHTEKEILALHGMGKASLPVLKDELKKAGLQFKND